MLVPVDSDDEQLGLGFFYGRDDVEFKEKQRQARQRQKIVAEKRWNMPGVASPHRICRWTSKDNPDTRGGYVLPE